MEKQDGTGLTYYEIRIIELPDFLVVEGTPEQARASVGEALEAFIDSYLMHGEEPPVPEGVDLGDICFEANAA